MAILYLLLILIIGCAAVSLYRDKRYKETSYYQITKNAYSSLSVGERGEYLIYKKLKHLEGANGKFLFNLYVPKSDNKTTEIDVLLLCPKGVFVFESKNFSGWIFGNEVNKNWMQTFPLGQGRSRKEQFYNPIMQNASHIRHLMRLIGRNVPIYSVIVFSDRCVLKNISVSSKHVKVTRLNGLAVLIAQMFSHQREDSLSLAEIQNIYNNLYPYTQVHQEIKAQHVNVIQNWR